MPRPPADPRRQPVTELAPCPRTPNCVATRGAKGSQRMEPIPYGDLAEARTRLLAVLRAAPRARVVEETETSLRVEFRSAFFRFVDDVELLFDEEEKLLHFRSASRLGRSDFGVNRKRMEELRRAFETAAPNA